MSTKGSTRKSEYKPLLFTTTVRSPERMRGLLNIFSNFDGEVLTNSLATRIVGELIRYGLYRPMKRTLQIKAKWKITKNGKFSDVLLSDDEVSIMLRDNPQQHKEAGFDKGWPSRFATYFDFAKELGFVYYQPEEKIQFSEVGLKLANSIDTSAFSIGSMHDSRKMRIWTPSLSSQSTLQDSAKKWTARAACFSVATSGNSLCKRLTVL